jgi:hypothetical protein
MPRLHFVLVIVYTWELDRLFTENHKVGRDGLNGIFETISIFLFFSILGNNFEIYISKKKSPLTFFQKIHPIKVELMKF